MTGGGGPRPYEAAFREGDRVRIQERAFLERFRREWRWHDPLQPEQVEWAGRATAVRRIGWYHGGDVVYELLDAPGTWHEACLIAADT